MAQAIGAGTRPQAHDTIRRNHRLCPRTRLRTGGDRPRARNPSGATHWACCSCWWIARARNPPTKGATDLGTMRISAEGGPYVPGDRGPTVQEVEA